MNEYENNNNKGFV